MTNISNESELCLHVMTIVQSCRSIMKPAAKYFGGVNSCYDGIKSNLMVLKTDDKSSLWPCRIGGLDFISRKPEHIKFLSQSFYSASWKVPVLDFNLFSAYASMIVDENPVRFQDQFTLPYFYFFGFLIYVNYSNMNGIPSRSLENYDFKESFSNIKKTTKQLLKAELDGSTMDKGHISPNLSEPVLSSVCENYSVTTATANDMEMEPVQLLCGPHHKYIVFALSSEDYIKLFKPKLKHQFNDSDKVVIKLLNDDQLRKHHELASGQNQQFENYRKESISQFHNELETFHKIFEFNEHQQNKDSRINHLDLLGFETP
ncbi:unnamed protein product [Ambrosiozyma monospora]|uniref:Unnamed protein product n=1 Tax=Ambrosiozyma monospora TaxID=43982 RepID=A0ACB5TYL8_AMBMO|nr:unnamed protein product [Ambrosiozyma monospora]